MNKRQLIDQLVAQLEEQLAALITSAQAAQQAATHEEARAENEYDTRGLEASYLAAGQAARAEEIRSQIAVLRGLPTRAFKKSEGVDVGALLELEDDDGKVGTYFLVPGRPGALKVGAKTIQVITPSSPLGRELAGKTIGDSVDVEVRGDVRGYTVVGLS